MPTASGARHPNVMSPNAQYELTRLRRLSHSKPTSQSQIHRVPSSLSRPPNDWDRASMRSVSTMGTDSIQSNFSPLKRRSADSATQNLKPLRTPKSHPSPSSTKAGTTDKTKFRSDVTIRTGNLPRVATLQTAKRGSSDALHDDLTRERSQSLIFTPTPSSSVERQWSNKFSPTRPMSPHDKRTPKHSWSGSARSSPIASRPSGGPNTVFSHIGDFVEVETALRKSRHNSIAAPSSPTHNASPLQRMGPTQRWSAGKVSSPSIPVKNNTSRRSWTENSSESTPSPTGQRKSMIDHAITNRIELLERLLQQLPATPMFPSDLSSGIDSLHISYITFASKGSQDIFDALFSDTEVAHNFESALRMDTQQERNVQIDKWVRREGLQQRTITSSCCLQHQRHMFVQGQFLVDSVITLASSDLQIRHIFFTEENQEGSFSTRLETNTTLYIASCIQALSSANIPKEVIATLSEKICMYHRDYLSIAEMFLDPNARMGTRGFSAALGAASPSVGTPICELWSLQTRKCERAAATMLTHAIPNLKLSTQGAEDVCGGSNVTGDGNSIGALKSWVMGRTGSNLFTASRGVSARKYPKNEPKVPYTRVTCFPLKQAGTPRLRRMASSAFQTLRNRSSMTFTLLLLTIVSLVVVGSVWQWKHKTMRIRKEREELRLQRTRKQVEDLHSMFFYLEYVKHLHFFCHDEYAFVGAPHEEHRESQIPPQGSHPSDPRNYHSHLRHRDHQMRNYNAYDNHKNQPPSHLNAGDAQSGATNQVPKENSQTSSSLPTTIEDYLNYCIDLTNHSFSSRDEVLDFTQSDYEMGLSKWFGDAKNAYDNFSRKLSDELIASALQNHPFIGSRLEDHFLLCTALFPLDGIPSSTEPSLNRIRSLSATSIMHVLNSNFSDIRSICPRMVRAIEAVAAFNTNDANPMDTTSAALNRNNSQDAGVRLPHAKGNSAAVSPSSTASSSSFAPAPSSLNESRQGNNGQNPTTSQGTNSSSSKERSTESSAWIPQWFKHVVALAITIIMSYRFHVVTSR